MISPGSRLKIDLPFQWWALVREKKTGKTFNYWINGNQLTRENLADAVEKAFTGVKVISCERAISRPIKTLVPIPSEHFQCGALKLFMGETDQENKPGMPRPISLKPLSLLRKPLWQHHS